MRKKVVTPFCWMRGVPLCAIVIFPLAFRGNTAGHCSHSLPVAFRVDMDRDGHCSYLCTTSHLGKESLECSMFECLHFYLLYQTESLEGNTYIFLPWASRVENSACHVAGFQEMSVERGKKSHPCILQNSPSLCASTHLEGGIIGSQILRTPT